MSNKKEYMREYTRKNKDKLNAKRRERYKLDPNYLKQSQLRLAKWRGGIIQYITELKLNSGCIICNYNKYAGALDYHHIDSSTKSFGIGSTRLRPYHSLEEIKEEIKKCIIVCTNCHREIHGKIIDITKYIK